MNPSFGLFSPLFFLIFSMGCGSSSRPEACETSQPKIEISDDGEQLKHGTNWTCDSEGRWELAETWKNGKRDGEYLRWVDGVLREKGAYSGGEPTGMWFEWTANGERSSKTDYSLEEPQITTWERSYIGTYLVETKRTLSGQNLEGLQDIKVSRRGLGDEWMLIEELFPIQYDGASVLASISTQKDPQECYIIRGEALLYGIETGIQQFGVQIFWDEFWDKNQQRRSLMGLPKIITSKITDYVAELDCAWVMQQRAAQARD